MKNLLSNMMRKTFFGFLLTGFFISCTQQETISPTSPDSSIARKNNEQTKSKIFYGPTQHIGQGVARAWVEMSKEGTPLAIGVNFSEKALQKLPHEMTSYLLALPKQAKLTTFDHIYLDWNPHGHDPVQVYGKPHFDFHFYTISQQERLAIPGLNPPAMDLTPDAKYIPPMYLQTPGLVPAMGAHWVDLLSAEFQPGGEFSRTFIFGSYKGEFIFYEPMITLDYLLSKPNEKIAIRQPQAYQKSGYYPLSYVISYSESPKEYSVALVDLAKRDAE
jgi:hypothetical protein